jgi:nucleotide-binding universal stress UspA family protein
MANIRAFARVLVALDFSPHSTRVLERVALLPLMRTTKVTLLHVRPPAAVDLGGRQLQEAARTLAETAAAQVRKQFGPGGPSVESVVARGIPARVIGNKARTLGAELIVLGRRGSGVLRRLALGSTAEGVLHAGVAPVLVVSAESPGFYQTPLVAADLSDVAEQVMREVRRILPGNIQRVRVLHVFRPSWSDTVPLLGPGTPTLQAHRERERQEVDQEFRRLEPRARDLGLPVELVLEDGDPREAVVSVAQRFGADLIAIGTRGQGRAARGLLGSVASGVLRDASCDVFVVPPSRKRG